MPSRKLPLPYPSTEQLLSAYRLGVFPMAPSSESSEIDWVEPIHRGILPLDAFHVPRNLRAHLRKTPYQISINRAFEQVLAACADRSETWISQALIQAYVELHRRGHAHSLEVWLESELVGGQYGVTQGAAFFGESMFHRTPYADQAALVFTHQHLVSRGFALWDTQFWTPHLGRFGCIEMAQSEYLQRLEGALALSAEFA